MPRVSRSELPAPNEWHVVREQRGWRVVMSRECPPQITRESLAEYQENFELLRLEKLWLLKRVLAQ